VCSSDLKEESVVVKMWYRFAADFAKFSITGLIIGTLCFVASLTPSLLPRPFALQGALSGLVFAIGYGLGSILDGLWKFLGLPINPHPYRRNIERILFIILLAGITLVLWHTIRWQNSIHAIMSMKPVGLGYPVGVLLVAAPTGIILIGFARLIGHLAMFLSKKISAVLPKRISVLIGICLCSYFLFVIASGTIGPWSLRNIDALQYQLDQLIEDNIEQPQDDLSTGGPSSLIPWAAIGRQGRRFVVSGPTRREIGEFTEEEAKRPIRVYAGLGVGNTAEERASNALQELIRVGGFERSVLVIATPTGTGMLDPAATNSLEYLHHGDTAIVSMQYSYLTSYVSILVEPKYSHNSARALFDAVYSHWQKLPKNSRPKLYLFGLSLGSSGSEASMDLHVILGDLIQGAVWSGPPFTNRIWGDVTRSRKSESPEWLPIYRDGSLIRFTAQKNNLATHSADWGPVRIVYVQYASDPITFFSTRLFYRQPDWLSQERGPDVSPYLRWYPIITALQVAFDMASTVSTPIGYGHFYSPSSYIDAWLEVSEPKGWTKEKIIKLKTHSHLL